MKIHFVIHADFEMPGIILYWARENGFEMTYTKTFKGEKLPQTEAFDWLILMGGPQSPLELDLYPYLADEIKLVERAVAADKVVLGFCLGAQVIGEAHGGKTERSPNKEVGIYPITLTEKGKKDPLLNGLEPTFQVMHWHNDMPGLGTDSAILAYSEGCPRQIVKYAPKIYGFQCHPEPTQNDIAGMVEHCESDLHPGRYVQTKEQLLGGDFPAINRTMVKILNNLKDLR
jgi:GMP synthase (glutamine-hydrolysing)